MEVSFIIYVYDAFTLQDTNWISPNKSVNLDSNTWFTYLENKAFSTAEFFF